MDRGTIETYLNELPCFEFGGELLFRKKSVENWIEARERRVGLSFAEPALDKAVPMRSMAVKEGIRWTL